MPSFGTFSAWIETDEGKLDEFSVEYSPIKKMATCWVASQEGKTFKIMSQIFAPQFPVCVRAQIDGTKTPHCNIQPSTQCEMVAFNGFRTSVNTCRLFQFAKYRLLEDEDTGGASLSPGVGDLTVEIHRVELGEPVLGSPVATREQSRAKFTRRITYEERVATFIFKYRPLDVLRADGIAPCAPPVIDLSIERPHGVPKVETLSRPISASAQGEIIDLTLDDDDVSDNGEVIDLTVETRAQALEEELAALKAQLALKKKRKRPSNDDASSVKNEIKRK
ncbi:hypothetical protein BJ165DRAFT_1614558 [Panaeolus papilionaceus]|nr:hypothetical protein BJ165DRAFT_1614558 [Panaeolus papilionaceus]